MNIIELRNRTGMSQETFAKFFHIKLKALKSWERGWRKCPEHVTYMIENILDLRREVMARTHWVHCPYDDEEHVWKTPCKYHMCGSCGSIDRKQDCPFEK